MASFSSSESISDIDSDSSFTYDVFLSFCNIDTGNSFVSYLYTALTVAGIVVFRDGDKLRNQDQTISNSVEYAIEGSRISIIVFSKNYLDSNWCFGELWKIMECYRNIGQMVVTVFYDVDPSDICHHQVFTRKAFRALAQKILKDESSEDTRFVVDSRSFYWNKSKDIKNVVQHAAHLLDKTYLFVADHPVGVESRMQEVIQLLNNSPSDHTLLVGMWGMGGVGKTTIAKGVYNQMSCTFEAESFLLNFGQVWNQSNGQVSLEEQFLSDIYKTKQKKKNTFGVEKAILKERLLKRKIFLVLDDVRDLNQFYAFCGARGLESFGLGSRIIITTRDLQILHALSADHIYEMKIMDKNESLEFFSWYAFKQPKPSEGFSFLSRDAVLCSRGMPLALRIMGSFLFNKGWKEWKNVLNKLKTSTNGIMGILRISFDGLLNDNVRKVFLVALNLIGMDHDDVIQILKASGYPAKTGIRDLVQQSLVTIDCNNRIVMHDMVLEFGRTIIRKQSLSMDEERIYDVFLSFRGEDSRPKFISHLYSALQNAGIYAFRDNDEIQRGGQISVSLLEAIRKSRISIVVLSRNYADSRWCMLELETIMDIGRTRGLVVVPVFYEVDPSEVRHQTGKFGEALQDLISRISVDEDRKRNWDTLLLEIGGIAGIVVLNSRNESEDITKVVEHVTNLLDRTDLFVADHPVGVDSRVQDIIQLLNSQESKEPLLLGIWGMGGIGKTTIAKGAYNKIRRDFEAKSFLVNIREIWEQDNGKVSLQQRLLSDIYKTTKFKIDTVESGKMILQERLSQKRILLVLDDVNKLDQLDTLCGSRKWFGQGSKIIITTRDDDLLCRLKVDYVYRVKEMDGDESLELFSWHAFKQPNPIEGFAKLSRDVVKYSGGLPLALQVIGSFLLTRRSKTVWKSVLEKLKLIPNEEVLEKLRISFDGLNDADVKEIFLDIAFFFIGMDQEDVTKILKNCGHYAEIGISLLVQQSLVTVDRKNKIGMHDLLRDMGRNIVRNKSEEGGKEPSRLWRLEDVQYVLSKDTRTINVKGLTLKMSRMDSTTYLKTKAFEKMDKLKLLQLAGVQLNGNYKHLSSELRWLCWHGFPLKYTPAEFDQGNLVSIDLKYSNLEQMWKKSQFLKELKILNLSHSHDLRETPDFSYLPNLEKLILKDCPSLSSISSTIEHLSKILLINLKDCTGLRKLPRSIYKLESLKTLIVSGCTKIDKLEEDIEQMKSLTTLVADKTAITRVPFALVKSKSIGYISLCGFKGFSRNVFPSIIQSWMSPTNNILSHVQTSAGTSSFDFLDEQNDSFFGLPCTFKDLQNLQRLWLKCESEAQLHQTIATVLDNLHTKSFKESEAMQNTPETSNIVISASSEFCSQVRILSLQNSMTSLLIQMGMNCHVTSTLRENILQKIPPNGSGFLPGDNHPNWLAFNENGSSVTFEVPQVDERSLKTIMCIVYSSSPDDITSEGLKVLMLINCTKKTIQLYKRDALLASFDEEEWQKVVSSTEPGDIMKLIVVFESKIVVNKTTVYLIYDEPIDEKTKQCCELDKNIIAASGDGNILGRLFLRLPSLVRTVLTSRPSWFCLAVILVWRILFHSKKLTSFRKWLPKALKVSAIQYQGTKFLWVMYNKFLNCCRRG